MLEVSDIDLMRLADGTLADPRRGVVEAEIAADPELQERLEAFLVTGKALAQLFVPIAEAPVPERLLATLRPGANATPKRLHRDARPVAGGWRDWFAAVLQPEWRLSPMTAAAALACVGAIGAAITLTMPQDTFVGEAPQALAKALETVTSDNKNTTIALGASDSAAFVVDLSFQHRDGRFCRQYYWGLDGTRAFVGFACSSGSGEWHIEKDGVAPVRTATNSDIRPADPGPTVQALEKAVDEVMVGDALEIERERALIQKGWPRKK